MEGKEETSDTDSGIILHSGPDSPTTMMKEVTTHTRAVKLKHQALEDRLELCLLELKKLCIREAELTGCLSPDYPLLPGEKPPQIRQRIGAAFKLDEQSILQRAEDSELSSVEAELSLQQQISVAARRLCQEEHLGKAVRRSRGQQAKREDRKLKELQEAVFRLRLEHGRASPRPGVTAPRDQGTSDESSLSDSAVLDEEEITSQSSHPSLEPRPPADPIPPSPSPSQPPPQTLEGLRPGYSPSPECKRSPSLEHESTPIQNSPWMESSLDQPYQKSNKCRSNSSKCSSPAVTPVLTPVLPPLEACLGEGGSPLQLPTYVTLRHTQSSSAPSTPEMQLRRGHSLRIPNNEPPFDPNQERGRPRVARRLVTDSVVTPPEYSVLRVSLGNPLYCSSSEDSNSEHSATSYTSSPCREHPGELPRAGQPPYGYHYANHDGHHYASPHNGHRYPSPHNGHAPQAYVSPSFYKNPQHQSSPSFHRGYVDEGRRYLPEMDQRYPPEIDQRYPPEMDMGRLYISQPLPPCPAGRYEYWYEEAPAPLQCAPRPLPAHVRLSRAPSLREYPQHPSRGLPRQVVSEELKSWHQRSQFRGPRPRSLDRHRQGAVRMRNVPGRESPLSLQHQEQQAQQRRVTQRAADGTPVQWYAEDDSEIVSQV